jgi:hypothetical protein
MRERLLKLLLLYSWILFVVVIVWAGSYPLWALQIGYTMYCVSIALEETEEYFEHKLSGPRKEAS